MPRRHLERCLNHWQESIVGDADVQIVRDVEPCLKAGGIVAMLGKRGTGKTHQATRIACKWLSGGRRVRYTTAMEMFSLITSSYDTKKREIDAVREFGRPELLIVDEVNERRDTRNEDMLLTWIMDMRYRSMIGTLLCSNLTREAFVESVGPSITSRIWEDGAVIEVNDHNWRKDGK